MSLQQQHWLDRKLPEKARFYGLQVVRTAMICGLMARQNSAPQSRQVEAGQLEFLLRTYLKLKEGDNTRRHGFTRATGLSLPAELAELAKTYARRLRNALSEAEAHAAHKNAHARMSKALAEEERDRKKMDRLNAKGRRVNGKRY